MRDDNEDRLLRAVALQNAESIRIARQRAEQQTEATLQEQANLLNLTHDALHVRDMNRVIKYWNRGAEALYGWTADEAIGTVVYDLLKTIFPAPIEQIEGEVVRTGRWEGELVHTRKDGTQIVVASRWSLQRDETGAPVAILVTNNDITERRQSEQARQRSEAYLAEAQRLTHTGSWAWAPGSRGELYAWMQPHARLDLGPPPAERWHYWSEEMFRIFEFDPHLGPPTTEICWQRIHPDDREAIAKSIQKALREKGECVNDFRILLSDGRLKYIHAIGHLVFNDAGEIAEFVGSSIDVTEGKLAEEKLREAEIRFRAYVDHATDAFFVHGAESGKIIDANRQACESLGYTREELIGMTPFDFDPNLDEASLQRLMERVDAGEIVTFETLHRRKDGIVFPVEVRARSFQYGGQKFGLSIARDITERKRAEEEREKLRQLEADLAHINRVSMMGELTASLAHELNQPITAAITNANTCLRWLMRSQPNLEEARDAAGRMVKDGTRAAEIINRLRSFYRKGAPPQRELVDLNEIIGDMLVLLRNEANRYSIGIRMDLAPELPKVMADRVQLQQVLMNLMLNAIEAMHDSAGELTIKSQPDEDGQPLISVSDTGVGLPDDNADQMFNAFFTTKPQGTGMGLAISRSIIEAHGGRLWATANSGLGATFHFILPQERAARA